ncbi:MAG TPA: membrane protein insertion efficiency factor YidD, partial [Thermoanaerobaculia bacterium]|nr:membrane protein insertion efficiency factor YidD [Thermoanaerobaculia bacterium]
DLYQATASPMMPKVGVRCRFQPTCSHYSEAAIRKYGTVKGVAKSAWRIARCGPWTPQGTVELP